jgi:glucuronoarabinoxylan endo-1,4-beta-xylanase
MKHSILLPAAIGLLAAVASAQTATVDFGSQKQLIDGFGASSAWHGNLSTAVLDAAFSNNTQTQLGLSILRVDIDPAGQSNWGSQKTNATAAKARGVQYVLATPWSPPASMKTNSNTVGGELGTGSYASYASYLKSYRTYMGSLVDVISVQNEPNITVSYTSCTWSPAQLYNFTKNNAQDIGGDVMMPETFNYDTTYSDQVLNDSTANSHVTHIGLHLYTDRMMTYGNAVRKNKHIWMTEHYYDPDDISTALTMGKEIMNCMNNMMNAYVWWYLVTPSCNLMDANGNLQLKAYVMGQFSKYIRPGFHRVSATFNPQSNVTVVAFTGTKSVIVALNQNTSSKSQTFTISNGTFANTVRYTTSSSKKLSSDGSVAVSNGSFTATLDAQSITTFVADATTGVDEIPKPSARMVREGNRILVPGDDRGIELRDIRGNVIRSARGGIGHAELDLGGLRPGAYVARSGDQSLSLAITGR